MSFLSQILGTILAFVTVMLAASLLVMCFVRIIQYLANERGKTLGEMLSALLQGYRGFHGDVYAAGDQEQAQFQLDVLTSPVLHMPAALPANKELIAEKLEADRKRLALRVDYINKDDLIEIIRRLCGAVNPRGKTRAELEAAAQADAALTLPRHWYRWLPEEARKLGTFLAYIDYWFRTVEGVSTEQFKLSSRRMTAAVSCILVVLLHIDAIQLATNIYDSSTAQEEIGRRAADLIVTAERMGAQSNGPSTSDREELLAGATENLKQLNGILNEPGLGLGWQNSRIARAWCASHGTCPKPQGGQPPLLVAVALSLLGLVTSGLLLSLGAPFWLAQLKNVLSLQNSIARLKPSPAPSSKDPPGS